MPHRSKESAGHEFSITRELPDHLKHWTLPSGWRWGGDGYFGAYRHYQEIIDNLSRPLSLVTAPDPNHADWLLHEAHFLGHRNHPSIPTAYLAWTKESGRGPGYLRRWIVGETVKDRAHRAQADVPEAMRSMRLAASCLASLHDSGHTHGAVGPEALWLTPSGRIWLITWQWALKHKDIPEDASPVLSSAPWSPEWGDPLLAAKENWVPTALSDQWQLAASIVQLICREPYVVGQSLESLCPDVPKAFLNILAKALDPKPHKRFDSLLALLRETERQVGSSKLLVTSSGMAQKPLSPDNIEASLRRITADDYEVMAPLGRGAFGSVWRVRDLALGRAVALKVLHPNIAADHKVISTFRREAQMAASLSHPAIVPIFDWDTRDGISWYTMDLAENGSVANLVASQGPRNLDEICDSAALVMDALQAAHTAGIIHRDIKPENLLIDRWGGWRIGDFGVAHYLHRAGTHGGTGSPAFAAPEQLLAEPLSPATDIFSLAAVIHYALTAQAPFGEDDPVSIIGRHLRADIQGLDLVPKALVPWLQKALASEPKNRYQTAAEAKEAWQAVNNPSLLPTLASGLFARLNSPKRPPAI